MAKPVGDLKIGNLFISEEFPDKVYRIADDRKGACHVLCQEMFGKLHGVWAPIQECSAEWNEFHYLCQVRPVQLSFEDVELNLEKFVGDNFGKILEVMSRIYAAKK